MRAKVYIFLSSLLVDATVKMSKPLGKSWISCEQIIEKIEVKGNGTTHGSCLGCDPVEKSCPPGCQSLLDAMSKSCRGVYAPQDQYFDPSKTLSGYWGDQIAYFRIAAARCGCSDAYRPFAIPLLAAVSLVGVIHELL